jgi:hypothetical protein
MARVKSWHIAVVRIGGGNGCACHHTDRADHPDQRTGGRMKFSVLALDFDGTIAKADTLDGDVREAIAALRGLGIVVILVTGRILEDLRRVTGGLHFVDAVVAENGAVVEFPASGYTMRKCATGRRPTRDSSRRSSKPASGSRQVRSSWKPTPPTRTAS